MTVLAVGVRYHQIRAAIGNPVQASPWVRDITVLQHFMVGFARNEWPFAIPEVRVADVSSAIAMKLRTAIVSQPLIFRFTRAHLALAFPNQRFVKEGTRTTEGRRTTLSGCIGVEVPATVIGTAVDCFDTLATSISV